MTNFWKNWKQSRTMWTLNIGTEIEGKFIIHVYKLTRSLISFFSFLLSDFYYLGTKLGKWSFTFGWLFDWYSSNFNTNRDIAVIRFLNSRDGTADRYGAQLAVFLHFWNSITRMIGSGQTLSIRGDYGMVEQNLSLV